MTRQALASRPEDGGALGRQVHRNRERGRTPCLCPSLASTRSSATATSARCCSTYLPCHSTQSVQRLSTNTHFEAYKEVNLVRFVSSRLTRPSPSQKVRRSAQAGPMYQEVCFDYSPGGLFGAPAGRASEFHVGSDRIPNTAWDKIVQLAQDENENFDKQHVTRGSRIIGQLYANERAPDCLVGRIDYMFNRTSTRHNIAVSCGSSTPWSRTRNRSAYAHTFSFPFTPFRARAHVQTSDFALAMDFRSKTCRRDQSISERPAAQRWNTPSSQPQSHSPCRTIRSCECRARGPKES